MHARLARIDASKEKKRARRIMLTRIMFLGWTQAELARRLGRNQGHVSRMFTGERDSIAFWRDAERVVSQAEAQLKKRTHAG